MDFDATGSFVDNALMVLVARHKPSLEDTDEFGDPIIGIMTDPAWNLVASSLQTILRHPQTETERLALRWVDPQHFNPAICRHRAQYILWRQRKQKEEEAAKKGTVATKKGKAAKPEVSDYNVLTSPGLKVEVDQLMADVKSKLPSMNHKANGAANSDDEDSDDDVEIFRPPANMLQSDTDVAQAEAEAALLQQVQDMQLEHYKKYHKWVETSYASTTNATAGGAHGINYAASHTASAGFSSSNNGTPSKATPPTAGGGKSGLTSHDDVQDIPLDQCTTTNIADLLEYLGIPEHQNKFRRTTGRLLLQLKKEDVRERFGEDFEAADLLWSYVEENRIAVPSAAVLAAQKRGGGSSSSSTAQMNVKKLYEDARAPSSNLTAQANSLKAFEAKSNPQHAGQQQARMQELLAKGDLSSIKRSLNPNRPARPSARQEVYDYSTSEDDAAWGADYLKGVRGGDSEASTPEKGNRYAAGGSGGVSKSMPYGARPSASSETESNSSSGGATAGAGMGGGNPAAAKITTTAGPRTNSSSYVDPVPKKATTTTAPPVTMGGGSNSRANRWAVVEYSDEDSDDN